MNVSDLFILSQGEQQNPFSFAHETQHETTASSGSYKCKMRVQCVLSVCAMVAALASGGGLRTALTQEMGLETASEGVARMLGTDLGPGLGLKNPAAFAQNRCPKTLKKCLLDRARHLEPQFNRAGALEEVPGCSQEIDDLIAGLQPISHAAQDLKQCVSSAKFAARFALALPDGEEKIENGPPASDSTFDVITALDANGAEEPTAKQQS